MIRKLLVAWLSLLLLGAQYQVIAHQLDHTGSRLRQGDKVVVQDGHQSSCLQCSLLAAGSNVVPCDGFDSHVDAPQAQIAGIAHAVPVPRAPLPPYLSRAPPAFV